MNKRLSALLAAGAALILFSACAGQPNADAPVAETAEPEPEETVETESAWNITMRDIIDANHIDSIFPAYGSVRVDYQYEEEPDGRLTAKYADADILYFEFEGEQDAICRDGSGGYLHVDEDDSYGAIMDFTFDAADYEYAYLDPDLTAQEEILSVEEDGDVLYVTTRFPAELLMPYFPEGEFPYAEGDYMEEAYELNASDYAMLSDASALVHADGSREPQDKMVMTFGAERPEIVETLLERKDATENIRTGTIVLDPGTPEERTLTATAIKGDYIYYTLPEGYETIYEDPECEVESIRPSEPTEDFISYSKKADA